MFMYWEMNIANYTCKVSYLILNTSMVLELVVCYQSRFKVFSNLNFRAAYSWGKSFRKKFSCVSIVARFQYYEEVGMWIIYKFHQGHMWLVQFIKRLEVKKFICIELVLRYWVTCSTHSQHVLVCRLSSFGGKVCHSFSIQGIPTWHIGKKLWYVTHNFSAVRHVPRIHRTICHLTEVILIMLMMRIGGIAPSCGEMLSGPGREYTQ